MMNTAPVEGINGINGSPYRTDDRYVIVLRKELRAWPFAIAAIIMGSAQTLLFSSSFVAWTVAVVLLGFCQVKHALLCVKNREIREENERIAREAEGPSL